MHEKLILLIYGMQYLLLVLITTLMKHMYILHTPCSAVTAIVQQYTCSIQYQLTALVILVGVSL